MRVTKRRVWAGFTADDLRTKAEDLTPEQLSALKAVVHQTSPQTHSGAVLWALERAGYAECQVRGSGSLWQPTPLGVSVLAVAQVKSLAITLGRDREVAYA